MRIGQINQGRPQYYDRNPTQVEVTFNGGGIAPHVATTRASYTVPTNRKAYVEITQGYVQRDTAAAPAARSRFEVQETPSGSGAFGLAEVSISTNAVGDQAILQSLSSFMLGAGDLHALATQDASTGGTCYFHLGSKIVEYDS